MAHWVQHTLCYAWIYSIHTYFTERTKPGCLSSAKLHFLVSYSAGSLGTRLRERLLGHKRKLLGHVPQQLPQPGCATDEMSNRSEVCRERDNIVPRRFTRSRRKIRPEDDANWKLSLVALLFPRALLFLLYCHRQVFCRGRI